METLEWKYKLVRVNVLSYFKITLINMHNSGSYAHLQNRKSFCKIWLIFETDTLITYNIISFFYFPNKFGQTCGLFICLWNIFLAFIFVFFCLFRRLYFRVLVQQLLDGLALNLVQSCNNITAILCRFMTKYLQNLFRLFASPWHWK